MSIPNIPEVSRVPGSTSKRTADAAAAAPSRPGGATTTPGTAPRGAETPEPPVSKQPSPPRFPWLSRLSQQLEPVAKQKPTFPSAPVLGDNVDKSA